MNKELYNLVPIVIVVILGYIQLQIAKRREIKRETHIEERKRRLEERFVNLEKSIVDDGEKIRTIIEGYKMRGKKNE
jgi:uncharacterized membrane-anchored protein YhcB (DUF1043 family)